MDAPAIAPLQNEPAPRPETRTATDVTAELAPLVAVCGLVGGAGTSTLAYLLARYATSHDEQPVLLAELGDHGGLAALVGSGSQCGLAGLARAVDLEVAIRAPYVVAAGGLRVVANERPNVDGALPLAEEALSRVLLDARAAHCLVVVDAGSTPSCDVGALLCRASHVVFVVSTAPAALARLERLAAAGGLPTRDKSSTLGVVATRPGRRAALKAVRALAEQHFERLLLLPHIAAIADGRLDPSGRELESVHSFFEVFLRGLR
jgi:hypothetical protein